MGPRKKAGRESDPSVRLQDDRIAKALQLREDERLDFKRVGSVDTTIKTACAMANTEGGWIVLGIEDPNKGSGMDRVYGIEEKPECMGNIRRDLLFRIGPPLKEPHISGVSEDPIRCHLRDGSVGSVVLLRIPRSNAVHSLVDGGTYIRSGPQNRQLSAVEITELSLRRGIQSAVDATVNVPIELLNTPMYKEYARERKLSRQFPEQLKHLGLYKKRDGIYRPTRAAILLFAENPGGLLDQKCAIRVFHYLGHQIEHREDTNLARPPVTIDGPVLTQIRQAVQVVAEELQRRVQVSPTGFEVKQEYPLRVIQEAITNAVIHRDYRLSQDIHIRIFANRIEVESPGMFPGAITTENLREAGSHPRNRTLVDHLREFPNPPNLDAGEGVRMMFATLEAKGLYPPVYRTEEELDREVVQVDLLNEARHSEWELVQDYLRQHRRITNADVRRITNCRSTVRASKLLHEWVAKGLLMIGNPDEGTRLRFYTLQSRSERRLADLEEVLSDKADNQPPRRRK